MTNGYGMMVRLSGVVLAAFVSVSLLASSVQAQSSDVQALLDRINRLEADLNNVQRKVFQGQDVPAPSVSSSSSTVVPQGEAAALLSSRLDSLEEEQRGFTGSLEEVTFKVDQLKNRLDKLILDIDFRLSDIERRLNGGQSLPLANSGPAGQAGSEGNAAQTAQGGSTATGQTASNTADGLPKGTQLLGTLRVPKDGGQPLATTSKTPGVTPPATPSASETAAAPSVANLSPAEQYNQAIALIRKDDYAGAEAAFTSFLEQNSQHSLAGNAQYWLGETHYVRGDYPNAASAFLNGYQNYPQSSKGADNLLKLAMTLGRMEQKDEACVTFQQLEKQYKNLASRLKRIAGREKQKFGCS
ncbi:MAG: tol-pal system protein YbgF [Sneathiellales bacterium]|nr:tol-pal system protein YbgF [Sneathiellales bacterium]